MKKISSEFQAHLDSATTTLAHCWKITRRDMVVQGFTEHDQDLKIDGVVYRASTGFVPGQIEQGLDLAIGNMEVSGALRSQTINEEALVRGVYDDAEIEVLLVNWSEPDQRVTIAKGNVGEVKRNQTAFSVEIRSQVHRLAQKTGRVYQAGCDANVGDEQCGKNIATQSYTGSAVVEAVRDNRVITLGGVESYGSGWFSAGLATFTSGANNLRKFEIKNHQNTGGEVTIELWQQTPDGVAIGDQLDLVTGCDKQFLTCKEKFSNIKNFRGFPHMPGTDIASGYASQGSQKLDGGSLNGN